MAQGQHSRLFGAASHNTCTLWLNRMLLSKTKEKGMVALVGVVDLDFDDNLAEDAKAFGQQIAQGDAKKLSQPLKASPGMPESCGLKEALYIAREVYGETNSPHSEVFYQWVQTVLEGGEDIEAAKKMLALLHKDKENFGGRISWQQYTRNDADKIGRLRARRNASICAMNIVRAVLNKAKGRCYMLWVERSLWRAIQAEKDVKTER